MKPSVTWNPSLAFVLSRFNGRGESFSARALVLPIAVWLLVMPTALRTMAGESGSPGASESTAESHWSHLPIWGAEARSRGYELPLPFGVGVNLYHEKQPFNVTDLQVSVLGRDLVNVDRFVEVEQIQTRQNNCNARLDAWLFPFLNVYGLVGYTSGDMDGTVFVPQISAGPVVIVPATTLPLNISYHGPTYGGGATLAGGTRISRAQDMTLFVAADANYTQTPLDFKDEDLESDSTMTAWIASVRLGIRHRLSEKLHTSFWAGSMVQFVDQTLEGRVPSQNIRFAVTEESEAPVNALLGMRLELGSHCDLVVEGGIGTRTSIMGSLGFRF